MEIHINGKQAYLKKGTSIEYISENRLFTGSDSYTLTITFPLRGCKPNMDIFGHIYRKDVEKNHIRFNCEIRDKQWVKTGTITITEISEVDVKNFYLLYQHYLQITHQVREQIRKDVFCLNDRVVEATGHFRQGETLSHPTLFGE